ncbi:type VI secretion protein VasK [Enterobacteriaceae bacterium YMB-R22]|nr:type VI secretion protein VasK [Tenebrionicola larvae]
MKGSSCRSFHLMRRTLGNINMIGYFLFVLSTTLLAIAFILLGKGEYAVAPEHRVIALAAVIIVALMLFLLRDIWKYCYSRLAALAFRRRVVPLTDDIAKPEVASSLSRAFHHSLRDHLRAVYTFFWRAKVRLLLVVGDDADVDALVPELRAHGWAEGHGTVLIAGGDLKAEPDTARLDALRRLARRRPLDGIVWVTRESDYPGAAWMDHGLRHLQQVGARLRWHAPLYLWQLSKTGAGQAVSQPVGTFFPAQATEAQVSESLNALPAVLLEHGIKQVTHNSQHNFLLRLGLALREQGAARWQQTLSPWFAGYTKRIALRGLVFSPLPEAPPESDAARASSPSSDKPDAPAFTLFSARHWQPDASWSALLADCKQARGLRPGVPWLAGACWTLAGLMTLWGAGMLLSFAVNRHQIADVAAQAQSLKAQEGDYAQQLMTLKDLRNRIARLHAQQQHGSPWYQRFGLDMRDPLFAALMPLWGEGNNRLLRDEAQRALTDALYALASLPPDSPQRAAGAQVGYGQLKALLMMARPQKADPAFFAQVMRQVQPQHAGLSQALWQDLSADLWAFYMSALPSQPGWAITPDAELVSRVRQVLLQQTGRRHAESALYEALLKSARRNYADLRLEDMTGDTDASRLFTTREVVPGMFTRRAWEGQVRAAIEKAARSRREEIDWVLSDSRQTVSDEVSPEQLKQRLTARYFNDFAGSWLGFLNSLRWNATHNLSEVTEQLTLMSDVRQSPLIALMNTLAWQGQTGRQGRAPGDVLLSSARELLHKDDAPVISQQSAGPTGPLDGTFGPLLTLMGKGDSGAVMGHDGSLSLQTYLTRVTRVRLRLQQVASAPDPQEMMQALAQTVFRGKSVDLTDTREYGSLVAASLGEEWRAFGRTVFVQPLRQAWETVLQPSAASLNQRWQDTVVNNWNSAFAGRYPFAAGKSEASVAMLAEFIRRDAGRIPRFLDSELGGVLRREGTRWAPDPVNARGLNFDPAFLRALSQLSELADVMFTDGSQGIRFELLARPAPGVTETTLTVDGQKLRYFNQMESWHRFRWPGETYKPGAMLTWSSAKGGAKLYGDWQGAWGLVRWLEKAKRARLDESRWQLTYVTRDAQLQWILRTELGEGPLSLLRLRGFRLPSRIFSVDAQAMAQAMTPPETAAGADDDEARRG